MKKGQIYNYHLEIQSWFNKGSVLYYFNKSRIQDFYKEYSSRLETIDKELLSIQKKYFVFEEIEGKEQMKVVDGKAVLQEGKIEADANQDWADLMNQTVMEPLKLIRPN